MSHTAEEWTDRFGRQHTSCVDCEDAWPCRESVVKPPGWLLPARVDGLAAIEAVAYGFGVTTDDIMGASLKRHVLIARHCAMAVVKETTALSYTSIGALFGKDHTTVMNAVRRVMGDPELAESVRLVVEELSPHPQLFAVADREAM